MPSGANGFDKDWLKQHELRTALRNREISKSNAVVERTVEHALPRKAQAEAKNPERIIVRVTSVRTRLLDEDNLAPKFYIDSLRYAGLIPSDAPAVTKIEVSQRKCGPGEEEHVIVEIFQ